VLSVDTVLRRDGIEIADVSCRHGAGRGDEAEHADQHTLVFVRRGCFARSANGVVSLLDPTAAYFMNPGEEHRYDHPHDDGDDCTALILKPGLVASLCGGEPRLPTGAIRTGPALDLEHRLLLAAARSGGQHEVLAERAIMLAASAIGQSDARRAASGRPATERARRAIVDGAREALAAEPSRSLPELSGELAVSPHHLSRIFRSATGDTIARHRMRLRARSALERLAGGERDLARLAADLGFADQSHLCRVVRLETGTTPSALRASLAA